MKQSLTFDRPSSHGTIGELYERDRDFFSLSSEHRPKREKRMQFSFRQTAFPELIRKT